MCGRFAQKTDAGLLAEYFDLDADWPAWMDRYNLAPSQTVAVVRARATEPANVAANLAANAAANAAAGRAARELVPMQWGLVPHWSKDRAIGAKLFNARSETAAEKPSFRDAFRRRRCVIPADCFFEWKKVGRQKLPMCVRARGGEPLALAGLWEQWQDPAAQAGGAEPQVLETCTILTTTPNALLKPIHDRMPVILAPDQWREWLQPAAPLERLQALCAPCPAERLTAYPVGDQVNNARHNDPRTLDPRADDPPETDDPQGQGRLF